MTPATEFAAAPPSASSTTPTPTATGPDVGPAGHGHISKQGSASARHALVEASWSTVQQPGPIAAFYTRRQKLRPPPAERGEKQ
jgi:hypothetical protein